jgi:adenylosuccinate synthase
MSDHTAYVVVDLGYGDAGKGSLIDALTARTGARLNVRFNGGGQAAHNVVLPDGRHHTFSQFGSGMFDPGVKTYLARHFLWNPIAMQAEAASLDAEIAKDEKGPPAGRVMSRTFVDKAALVVTPWHQAINRLREFARDGGRQTNCGRDGGRHGSCGVGIGEAMMESRDRSTLSLRAGDLQGWAVEKLRWHLEEVAESNLTIWNQLFREHYLGAGFDGLPNFLLKDRDFLFTKDAPLKCASLFKRIACGTLMVDGMAERGRLFDDTEDVVFEGAQGILIDEKYGFDPHTTWSTCTSRNARQILKEIGWKGNTKVIGALRAYAVRHGNGPFVTEDHYMEFMDEHNGWNDWQGPPRFGWFDAVATHYAMRAEWESSLDHAHCCSTPGIHALAITNLDRMGRLNKTGIPWRICTDYEWNGGGPLVFEPGCFPRREGRIAALPSDMTAALFEAMPVYGCSGGTDSDLLRVVEGLLRCPIEISSRGPTRNDKSWFGSLGAWSMDSRCHPSSEFRH